ncbi:MAG TPA: DUF4253 domain-containing protein [Aggregatilineales bacterium]|nr:DUF4253 domain-containing protein [Aggregatilineales bacterium]
MTVPMEVIRKIDSALAINSRPHYIKAHGQGIDTECWEWEQPSDNSPEFLHFSEALKRIQETPEQRSALREQLNKISDETIAHAQQGDEAVANAHFSQKLFNLLAKEIGDPQLALAGFVEQTPRANVPTIDDTLNHVRKLIKDAGAIAYKSAGHQSVYGEVIVVAPTTNQFDILRIERTDAANYHLDTEAVIMKLKALDNDLGIDLIGATGDSVEFRLKRIPTGDDAKALGKWLLEFCPDFETAPQDFADGKVFLWWD